MRVIELTGSPNTSMREIAEVISNDQGLSSKVLKTVNSSFYGLSKPCTTINQSIVMLGLSAVKTLALGFSLVGSLGRNSGMGFDFPSYWRRGLLTGVAAKCIAHDTKIGFEEECFLAGLLQDVGMVAMCEALQDEYLEILAKVGDDHRSLVKEELAAFETSHAEIGAMLVGRWKLPPELAVPIKFHERPQGAPQDYIELAQAVGLGNIASDLMTSAEPALVLKKYYARAQEWFQIAPGRADDLMKKINAGAKEVAKLLDLKTAAFNDPESVRATANRQLLAIAVPLAEAAQPPAQGDLVSAEPNPEGAIEPASGLPGRLVFSQNVVAVIEQFAAGGGPYSIAMLSIDDFAGIQENQGEPYADEVLARFATALTAHFESTSSVICSIERGSFGVLLIGVDRLTATRQLEQFKLNCAASAMNIKPIGLLAVDIVATVSAGLLTLDNTTRGRFNNLDAVMDTVGRALASAQRAGTNVLRVFVPKQAAA
jgi:HD-like signal output (HDOD) protein/GGDEF domain-containing protein